MGVRVPALLGLFTVFALIEAVRCSSLSSLSNADAWWHLSSGLWILQHHALPHTGVFSQLSDAPWIDASWIYDLKLAIFYRLIGLRAIPVFSMGCKAGLAVVTFLLAGGRRGNFRAAVLISLVAQYILAGVPPTPTYASVLLFGVELVALLEARRSGRLPMWLPLVFLAWANADMHFVCGLGLLLLFAAVSVVEFSVAPPGLESGMAATHGLRRGLTPSAASRLDSSGDSRFSSFIKPGRQSIWMLGAVVAACMLATLITPYFFHPYQIFFGTTFSAANAYLPDCHAPGFRRAQDYVLLLLAMSGFLALGLRRSRDWFLIALLAISAGVSFYSQRDVWVVVLAAVAVLGETVASSQFPVPGSQTPDSKAPWRELLISGGLACLVLALAAFVILPRSASALLGKVGESYPVAASDVIRAQRLPQPLFNAFEWGGFLSWYLPEYPVAIDGRVTLYGDDYVVEYSKVMNADVRYTDFPAMANARTIVLPASAIMAQALKTLPGFKVAYSDSVALVLTRDGDGETPVPLVEKR